MTGPRRRRYEIPGHARYLTFSCRHRLPLFLNDRIKDAFTDHLASTRRAHGFRLLAWVVMPEHVHLLIVPNLPAFPLSRTLSRLKRPFAETVIRRWRSIDAPVLMRITDVDGRARFWERGGGYDRNVFSTQELHEKIEYIHANPVRRGLVERPDHWRWSSAPWYAGDRSGAVEIDRLE